MKKNHNKLVRMTAVVLSLMLLTSCLTKTKTVKIPDEIMASEGDDSGEFDTQDGEGSGDSSYVTTPGKIVNNTSNTKISDSAVSDKSALEYCYDGDDYRYAITSSGKEVIAYKGSEKSFADLLSGAGSISLKTDLGVEVLSAGGVAYFDESIIDNTRALTVRYNGSDSSAIIETTYYFYHNHISVQSRVNYTNEKFVISEKTSFLNRFFMQDSSSIEKRISTKWVYPEDGDYPYQDFDAIVTVNHLSGYSVYTFQRDTQKSSTLLEQYPETALPMNFSAGKSVDYTVKYDLVLAKDDGVTDNDYLALFKSKNSDFAAGITPVDGYENNAAVFTGSVKKFNINITNLTKSNLSFTLRYDVRDYYGNIVDKGYYKDSTVFKNMAANRVIALNASKYGMYYLNLRVVSENSDYTEYYPFIMAQAYNFTSNSTSPFGICQQLPGSYADVEDLVGISKTLGMACARIGISDQSQTQRQQAVRAFELHRENNIRVMGMNLYAVKPTDGNAYEKSISENLSWSSKNLIGCEVGNEDNMEAVNGGDEEDVFARYRDNVFLPGYNSVVKEYGLPYAAAAISAGSGSWFDKMARDGLWNKFDILSLHPYGFPYAPDNNDITNAFWNTECALKRTKQAMDKYGQKELYVSEIGIPTPPVKKGEVGLRTQADYMVRAYMLCLLYGARSVLWYDFCDYGATGLACVSLSDNEVHYGMFYYPDYYGIMRPKPSAAAFAGMTRVLESVSSVSESETYSKGTVRAFDCMLNTGEKVITLWSNCSVQSEDNYDSNTVRTPNLPWNSNWSGFENVTLTSAASAVTVVDMMGNSTDYAVTNGKAEIPVTGSPIYVKNAK